MSTLLVQGWLFPLGIGISFSSPLISPLNVQEYVGRGLSECDPLIGDVPRYLPGGSMVMGIFEMAAIFSFAVFSTPWEKKMLEF